jgi:hypothetical protein
MAKPAIEDWAFLHTHGIRVEPKIFDEMVQEAVKSLPRILDRADPRVDLSAAEAKALVRGGFQLEVVDLGTEDPLARTAAEYAALLKTSLSTADAARRLGVDPSRIRQRLTSQSSTLYGIRLESGWVIPEFQFEGNELLSGISEVVPHLDPELHPVSVFRWFTLPNPDLIADELEGRALSPRDWLRLGYPPGAVAAIARDL